MAGAVGTGVCRWYRVWSRRTGRAAPD